MSDGEAGSAGAAGEVSGGDVTGQAQGSAENTAGRIGAPAASKSTDMSSKEAAATRQAAIRELGDQDMDSLVTLKVNGKEEKVPLREALKISRMEKASQAKMQEAAQLKAQASQIIQMAKSNPKAFFQQTGIDPYEFAEATLAEKYEMMQMTPEQKKLMEYEQRVKQYEDREKQDKQTREQQDQHVQTEKIRGEIQSEMIGAFKDVGIQPDVDLVARVSAEMMRSIAQKKAGYREEALSAKEALDTVLNNGLSMYQRYILSVAKADPEKAQKTLGDELLKILRDHDVKRVTGQSASRTGSQNNRPANQAVSGKSKNMTRSMSEKEWNEYFKSL